MFSILVVRLAIFGARSMEGVAGMTADLLFRF